MDEVAKKIAITIYQSSVPDREDMSAWARATGEWCENGFDKMMGHIFDEVNALRKSWWHDGTDDDRRKCNIAINNLGAALGIFHLDRQAAEKSLLTK